MILAITVNVPVRKVTSLRTDMPPAAGPRGNWVQTERTAHEAWAALIARAPKAAQLMHLLTSRIAENNAVVVSHKDLAALMNVRSVTTVKSALAVLEGDRWIEIRQIGRNGTVNAYIINDRVAWTGKRDGIRYSLFSATVIAADEDQPDRDQLGRQEPLRRLPGLFRDEQQLPSGDGLPPPSQPFFDGLEPDLPATGLTPSDWWAGLSDGDQSKWRDQIGTTFEIAGHIYPRNDRDIAERAFAYITTENNG